MYCKNFDYQDVMQYRMVIRLVFYFSEFVQNIIVCFRKLNCYMKIENYFEYYEGNVYYFWSRQ